MAHPESGSNPPAHWNELEASCAGAIRMSESVAALLRKGAAVGEYVPLLHQQSDVVGQLRSRIRDLLRQPRHPQDRVCRDRLVGQLRLLLDLEHDNHQLLARRGFRLRGPRPGWRR